MKVTGVEWVGVDPGSGSTNLTADNPPGHGGGYRIFAEKNTPSGPLHDKFRAKATLNVPVPVDMTYTVYFRPFDMDDPMGNGAGNLLDTNDTGGANNGNDNLRGSPGVTPSLKSSVVVDGNGATPSVAEQEYTITARQPGNNWRVVAHAVEDAPDQTQIDTDPAAGAGLDFLISAGGAALSPDYRTPLLFVWRTLHIELDSMASELDTGTSTGMTVNTLTDATKNWDGNQFASYNEEWHLQPATSQPTTFPVAANTATVITATTQPGQSLLNGAQVGDPYEVRYEGWPPRTGDPNGLDTLRGDLPEPNTTALAAAYEPTYMLVEHTTDETDTAWHHNFGFSQISEQAYLLLHRNIGVLDSDYWTASALGAYDDPSAAYDNDIDSEIGETAFSYFADVTVIYNEVSNDLAAQHSWTPGQLDHVHAGDLLHELGHWFGLLHSGTADNVMWITPSDPDENLYATLPLVFLDIDQRRIRNSVTCDVR